MTEDVLVELTDREANHLRKWGSVWFDLLQVDQALHERSNLRSTPETVFIRRALWESAVISYGRMGASDRRKVAHEELLEAVGGKDAMAFHAQVMGWRHGHVAHRTDKTLEQSVTVMQLDGPSSAPEALNLLISTWVGPDDDSPVAQQFRAHANKLRNAVWERHLAPIGESVVNRNRVGTSPALPFAGIQNEAERIMVTCTLWARSNGTGV